jgi:hypothetical protein
MRRFTIALALSTALPLASTSSAQLLIPDSGAGDRIMLFSEIDGSLINPNWVTDIGAVGWFFTTPKEAAQVGNEVWVPDQVADAVHRFDFNANFLGSITAHPNGGNLDNIRGLGTDGTNVWVTVFHGTAAQRGLAVYVTAGNAQNFLPLSASLFDVD